MHLEEKRNQQNKSDRVKLVSSLFYLSPLLLCNADLFNSVDTMNDQKKATATVVVIVLLFVVSQSRMRAVSLILTPQEGD